MPTFNFTCKNNHKVEEFYKNHKIMTEDTDKRCKECGESLNQEMGTNYNAFQFKGRGHYKAEI